MLNLRIPKPWEHRTDVTRKGWVWPEDKDLVGCEITLVVEQKPRHPVESDRGLAGTGATLNHEQLLQR